MWAGAELRGEPLIVIGILSDSEGHWELLSSPNWEVVWGILGDSERYWGLLSRPDDDYDGNDDDDDNGDNDDSVE